MYGSCVFEIPGGRGLENSHCAQWTGGKLVASGPSPQHLPHTSTFFLDLNFPIACVSQYEKILNSESTGKGRIHKIMLLKKSNSLICVPVKIEK